LKRKEGAAVSPKLSDLERMLDAAYLECDSRVLYGQAIAATIAAKLSESLHQALFMPGGKARLEDGRYVFKINQKSVTYGGIPYRLEDRFLEWIHATDFLRMQVSSATRSINYSIKTARSQAAKEMRKVAFEQEDNAWKPGRQHTTIETAQNDVANAKTTQKAKENPELLKWLEEMGDALYKLYDAENGIWVRLKQTVSDSELRKTAIGRAEAQGAIIEELQRAEIGQVKISKLRLTQNRLNIGWAVEDNGKEAESLWAKKRNEIGAWAAEYLKILVQTQYQRVADYPRMALLQPIYTMLKAKLPEWSWAINKLPKMDNLFSLPMLLKEYDDWCAKLPEYAIGKKNPKEKFIFVNRLLEKRAKLLQALALTMGELEKLPPDLARDALLSIQLIMLDIAQKKTEKEIELGKMLLALLPNKRQKAEKRTGNLSRLLEELGEQLAGLEKNKGKNEDRKLERALAELDYIHALELIEDASPVEHSILLEHYERSKMHGKYKGWEKLDVDLKKIRTREEIIRTIILFDKMAKEDGPAFGQSKLEGDLKLANCLIAANDKYLELLAKAPNPLRPQKWFEKEARQDLRTERQVRYDAHYDAKEGANKGHRGERIDVECMQSFAADKMHLNLTFGNGSLKDEVGQVLVEIDVGRIAKMKELDSMGRGEKDLNEIYGKRITSNELDLLAGWAGNGSRYSTRMNYLINSSQEILNLINKILTDSEYGKIDTALYRDEYGGTVTCIEIRNSTYQVHNEPGLLGPSDLKIAKLAFYGISKVYAIRADINRVLGTITLDESMRRVHEKKYPMLRTMLRILHPHKGQVPKKQLA